MSSIDCSPGYSHRGELEYFPNKCINQDQIKYGAVVLLVVSSILLVFAILTIILNRKWFYTAFFEKQKNGKRGIQNLKFDKRFMMASIQIIPVICAIGVMICAAEQVRDGASFADRNPVVSAGMILGEITFHIQSQMSLYLISKLFVVMVASQLVQRKIEEKCKKFLMFAITGVTLMCIRTLFIFIAPYVNPNFPLEKVFFITMAVYAFWIGGAFTIFGITLLHYLKSQQDRVPNSDSTQTGQAIKKIFMITVFIGNSAIMVLILCILRLVVLKQRAEFALMTLNYASGVAIVGASIYAFTWKTKVAVSPNVTQKTSGSQKIDSDRSSHSDPPNNSKISFKIENNSSA